MRKLLIIALVLLAPVALATTRNVTCSGDISAALQTAMTASIDGDIVAIGAGSCTISSTITAACSSWTVQGAGAGTTNITVNVPTGNAINWSCSNKSARVTAATWTRHATASEGMFFFIGNPLSFRFDHNTLTNDGTSAGRWNWIEGPCASPGCLIDHNTITNVEAFVSAKSSGDTASCPNVSPVSVDNCAGFAQWSQAMVLDQGYKEVYFEDNTFTWNAFLSNDMLDCQNGGRYVFRHNTVNGNDLFGHGYDSVSTSCLEITVYQNTITVNNANAPGAVLYRGGTGVVYQNIMPTSSHYAGYISIQNYRSNSGGANTCAAGRTNCNLCNGTNPIDGNTIGGWACFQGPGRGSSASQGLASYPIYEWDNCGTALGCTGTADQRTPVTDINDDCAGFTPCVSGGAKLSANRDWYDSVASFDGTVGIGIGVLASRPATCTTGVAYWATDQSKLYQCSATNTWSVYYTPYTYPHPLQGASSPRVMQGATFNGASKR